MKTALRVVVLFLCALMGLLAVGRGIALVVAVRRPGHGEVLGALIEGSVYLAGGLCVLSVAIEQLHCWRTHRKDDSLL
jgi:vacuolar-type H+-ATPase subunit I/STV1